MTKRMYIEPATRLVMICERSQLLAGSKSVVTTGLDDDDLSLGESGSSWSEGM